MSLPPADLAARSAAGLAERIALALLLGAAAADLLGVAVDAPALWEAGARLALAGIAAGGLALLAGLRERRSRRRTAALLAALGLFALAAWVRGSAAIPPDPAVLLAEGIAAALLLVAAWLKGRAEPAP